MFPERLRVSLSRLRLSSHSLRTETGWYGRAIAEREQRLCVLCDSDIEDEYHFVIKCPVYNGIRIKYINNAYTRNPSVYKFIKLMTTEKEKELLNLSKFILGAFDSRKSILNNT